MWITFPILPLHCICLLLEIVLHLCRGPHVKLSHFRPPKTLDLESNWMTSCWALTNQFPLHKNLHNGGHLLKGSQQFRDTNFNSIEMGLEKRSSENSRKETKRSGLSWKSSILSTQSLPRDSLTLGPKDGDVKDSSVTYPFNLLPTLFTSSNRDIISLTITFQFAKDGGDWDWEEESHLNIIKK